MLLNLHRSMQFFASKHTLLVIKGVLCDPVLLFVPLHFIGLRKTDLNVMYKSRNLTGTAYVIFVFLVDAYDIYLDDVIQRYFSSKNA